jgi:hypothetical protein
MSETAEVIVPVFDIEAARWLCNESTSEPWRPGIDGNLRVYGPDGRSDESGLIASFVRRSDIDFVTQARTLLPQALDEIERLRADVAFYRRAMRIRANYRPELVAR